MFPSHTEIVLRGSFGSRTCFLRVRESVGHDEDGTGIPELVEVGILGTSSQVNPASRLRKCCPCNPFPDVPDGHDQTLNKWGTESRPSDGMFDVSVKVKGALF